MRLKKEFETAVVNEPSVFEPLKFYYIYIPDSFYSPRQYEVVVLGCLSYWILVSVSVISG